MRRMALVGGLALAVALLMSPSDATSSQWVPQPVQYTQPVYTAVIDPFRPPAHAYGAGNRGLEYGDTSGAVVEVAAPGYVTFAGHVAGRLAITVEHADGIKTSYTGVDELWVREGDVIDAFTAIARGGETLHFSARIAAHYLDPQILIDASIAIERPRLVPPPSERGSG